MVAALAALIVVAGIALQAWDTYREYQQAEPGTVETTSPAEPQPSPPGNEPTTTPPADEDTKRLTFPPSVDTGFEDELEFKLVEERYHEAYEKVQVAEYEDMYLKSIYALAQRDVGADELLQTLQISEVRDVGEARCGVSTLVEYKTCVAEKDGTAVAVYADLSFDPDEFLITFATMVTEGLS